VGQQYITETLKNQVRTGRLSHAYLFIGTRGTGKTTCARILAKAVNCEHPVNGNPCNRCAACRGIEDGSVMDVVELDAASNNGVDDVRMLRDEAVFSPTTVRKRVYIIDEVHMLSKPAFNALLKILEEPPPHLMFILATTELNKVLPTILSRCQRHSFRRLDSADIAGRLIYVAGQEGIELSSDAALLLGRLADGGLRDGLSLLDQCSSSQVVDTETVLHAMGLAGTYRTRELAGAVLAGNAGSAVEQFGMLWRDGKDPSGLLGELSGLFRDTLLLRLAPQNGRELLSGAYGEDSLREIFVSDSGLLWMLNTIQKYQSAMAASANPRLQGELCLIELCGLRDGAPVGSPGPEATQSAPKPVFQPPAEKPAPAPDPVPETTPAPPETHSFAPSMAPTEPAAPAPIPEPADEESSEPAAEEMGEQRTWPEVLAFLNGKLPIGVYVLLSDPSQTSGELRGSELLLRLTPGFPTMTINTPENITNMRSLLSEWLGRSIQIRLENQKVETEIQKDKLDRLGQFGNVTIR